MKKENAVIFGVTGVVVAAVLIGGGIYMKTERDRKSECRYSKCCSGQQ